MCPPTGGGKPKRWSLSARTGINSRWTPTKGVVGWIVNVIGPLLTKTDTDVTLFQMPQNLPFTIDSVDSGSDWLAITGKVARAPKGSEAASKPSP